ncbi:LANO_0E00826g1_1 [Lachancea nothofagi CBS 11611]|uniref:LANO_0E00826g1_1 n=1 Tax=Lachancea nothofagi CBS 11611 TaxID=1266666 RepID=A0A1G4JPF6_9SACH|nr:LANO_0E00826g1_1 [Lachancea nothofagi CBS 11611]
MMQICLTGTIEPQICLTGTIEPQIRLTGTIKPQIRLTGTIKPQICLTGTIAPQISIQFIRRTNSTHQQLNTTANMRRNLANLETSSLYTLFAYRSFLHLASGSLPLRTMTKQYKVMLKRQQHQEPHQLLRQVWLNNKKRVDILIFGPSIHNRTF